MVMRSGAAYSSTSSPLIISRSTRCASSHVERGVEERGVHAGLVERADLVVHQRDQRADTTTRHAAGRRGGARWPAPGSTGSCRRRWASAPARRRRPRRGRRSRAARRGRRGSRTPRAAPAAACWRRSRQASRRSRLPMLREPSPRTSRGRRATFRMLQAGFRTADHRAGDSRAPDANRARQPPPRTSPCTPARPFPPSRSGSQRSRTAVPHPPSA